MSDGTDVSSKGLNTLAELKTHIKRWESEYFKENGHKPKKEDIDKAPDTIKDYYRQYWKARRKLANKSSDVDHSLPANDVWSCELNKSNLAKQKKIAGLSAFEYISEKLKNAAQMTSPAVKDFRSLNGLQRRTLDKNDVSHKDEEVKSKGNQSSASVSANGVLIQEDGQKDCNSSVLTSSGLLHEKRFNIIKSQSSSQNLKNSINVLSSPFVDISSRKNRFQMNVDSGWLERCTTINLHAGFPTVDSDTSSNAFVGKKNDQELNAPFKSSKETDGNDCSFFDCSVKSSVSKSKDSTDFDHSDTAPATESTDCKNKTSGTESSLLPVCSNVKTAEMPTNLNYIHETCEARPNSVGCSGNGKSRIVESSQNCSVKEDTGRNKEATSPKKKPAKKRKLCANPEADGAKHIAKKPSSSLNDNYVRVNIKKKVFVRGHHRVNVRKMKFQKWKQLKKSSGSSSPATSSACFKCGKPGHWARSCPASKGTDLLPAYDDDMLASPLPTIEEAAAMLKSQAASVAATTKIYGGQPCLEVPKDKEHVTDCVDMETENGPELIKDQDFPVNQTVSPLYKRTSDGRVLDAPKEVFEALKKMGYSEFRPGQEKAVMRILSGMSTLVVSATGSGKSLCYQLPAYLYAQKYNCISLVISPLVSLMEDQVTGLPSCLHAVCLHSGMTDTQKETATTSILNGTAQILLVSPEAIIGGKLSGNFLLSKLPPVAFVCIDEVHCLSEWSHNFRPSYLQLLKVLTDKMNVKCVLGLTATATKSIVKQIATQLNLEIGESVIGETSVPQNLLMTVSRDKDKDWALIELLKEERFRSCSSVLIYCIRREETERIATLLRTCLQQESCTKLPDEADQRKPENTKKKKGKGKQLLWSAEAYHAGLRSHKRHSVQKNFMAGKLRVVVATIAFGMGLDKADVRAIIHYNMPKSFDNYVQEIGRAGRDGLPAQCHLFLDSEGRDLWELRRHIYSNSVDRRTIRKLLQKVFMPCKCGELKEGSSAELPNGADCQLGQDTSQSCSKHERTFSIETTVQELDLKEENIMTLLCYLELHSKSWVEVLPPTYATCTIRCYGGAKQMKSLAHRKEVAKIAADCMLQAAVLFSMLFLQCPAVAAAMALDKQCGKEWDGGNQYHFQISEVASHMSWESSNIRRTLKQLEWTQINGKNRKTGVIVEFSDLSFHLRACGDLHNDELDAVLEFLYNRVKTQEEKESFRLNYVFDTFLSYAFSNYWSCADVISQERSDAIKSKIKQYFDGDVCDEQSLKLSALDAPEEAPLSEIRQHIRDFVNTHHDHSFTGRAVARIFHGISSPCYPAEVWGRVRKFWRSYLNVDFNLLLKVANEEILKLR